MKTVLAILLICECLHSISSAPATDDVSSDAHRLGDSSRSPARNFIYPHHQPWVQSGFSGINFGDYSRFSDGFPSGFPRINIGEFPDFSGRFPKINIGEFPDLSGRFPRINIGDMPDFGDELFPDGFPERNAGDFPRTPGVQPGDEFIPDSWFEGLPTIPPMDIPDFFSKGFPRGPDSKPNNPPQQPPRQPNYGPNYPTEETPRQPDNGPNHPTEKTPRQPNQPTEKSPSPNDGPKHPTEETTRQPDKQFEEQTEVSADKGTTETPDISSTTSDPDDVSQWKRFGKHS